MTGFIKPEEIHAAQEELVKRIKDDGDDTADVSTKVHEFLLIHPVTKKKESKPFRYVNGVYVTEEAYEEAESLEPAIEELYD